MKTKQTILRALAATMAAGLLCGCQPRRPALPPLAASNAPAAGALAPAPAPGMPAPALSIEELQRLLQRALILQAQAPVGSTIAFVTADALGTGSSGPGLVCALATEAAEITVVQLLPATRADGMRELQAYRAWLEQQGLTAIIVSQGDVTTLVRETGAGAHVLMQVGATGAYVVRGAHDTAVARALLAQLFPD